MPRTGLGQALGIATLDSTGNVPANQLANVPPVNAATSSALGTVEIPAASSVPTPKVPVRVAEVRDQLVNTTGGMQLATFTPTATGEFNVKTYFRVTGTNPVNVQIQVTYTSPGGAQTNTLINQSVSPGEYNTVPLGIVATNGSAITVTITCGTANVVFATAWIVGE